MIVSGGPVLQFVGSITGQNIMPPATALGWAAGGEIVAGVAFTCWTGSDIEITVATNGRGLPRGLLRACHRYAFGQLQCSRVSITTAQLSVIAFAERLGAKREGIKRRAFGPDTDGVILGILKEDWTIK